MEDGVGVVRVLVLCAFVQLAAAGYIVTMTGAPSVLSYKGGRPGFQRTKPMGPEKLASDAAHVQSYAEFLRASHDAVLSEAGIPLSRKLYSYTHTFNAFAADLTAEEARRVEARPEVSRVRLGGWLRTATTHSPTFLKLPTTEWKALGGPSKGAGEGVIIGVIDTGINPDHPAFSDKAATPYPAPPTTWTGVCTGVNFKCNKKLIGGNYFISDFLTYYQLDTKTDPLSPRDVNGHGTHTSSTAAGNYGYAVSYAGTPFGLASGIAPRAHVAMYKVFWNSVATATDPAGNQGSEIDVGAAIDQATQDGVDIISYSLGGDDDKDFYGFTNILFLIATQNGILASCSAGNDGPGAVTLGNVAPWLVTVGASTTDRLYKSTVTLGGKTVLTGVAVFKGAGTKRVAIINAANAALKGHSAANAALCYPNTLDPAKVRGKIVVCMRGGTIGGRVDKGLRVQQAGGVGYVLVNDPADAGSLVEDIHYLPAAHISYAAGKTLFAYLKTKSPTAQIKALKVSYGNEAPAIASFASRGPVDNWTESAFTGAGDSYSRNYILKPDVAAPGVSIWAAWSNHSSGDEARALEYNLVSGTSMAAPHVAGLAALIKQAHPAASPFAVKSMLQTGAYEYDNKNHHLSRPPADADPFDFGSGHINPPVALDPGLVFDSSTQQQAEFLLGLNAVQTAAVLDIPYTPTPLAPYNLNTPNMAAAPLRRGATLTLTRTVTSFYARAATYTAHVAAPRGVAVTVVPTRFSIAEGATRTFTVKLAPTAKAPVGWAFGSLTWTDGRHTVKSKLAVLVT